MNKKVFFLPILLLIIQSNKILGAADDDIFNQAKDELMALFADKLSDQYEARLSLTPTGIRRYMYLYKRPKHILQQGHVFHSTDRNVNHLLKMIAKDAKKHADEWMPTGFQASRFQGPLTGYQQSALDIIKKYYPEAQWREKEKKGSWFSLE